ncbi:MAG: hypothetical protein N2117_11860 [Anaerolineales bacterium]|nr:hypothetical protein [Anaerolineales bacterium]
MSEYTLEQIEFMLSEIERWRKAGLITERGAEILRRPYQQAKAKLAGAPPPSSSVVTVSASPSVAPVPSAPASVPPSVPPTPPVPASVPPSVPPTPPVSASTPSVPPAPAVPASAPSASSVPPSVSPASSAPSSVPSASPSIASLFLSEASIKIALYLGAFFVIAAALILAAVVETLRLPILLGVSALFGSGALGLKKRLPQPSFVLWLVFSALLLISAGVLTDQLYDSQLSSYWMLVMTFFSILWGFSTWFYVSRFFSLASFVALALAALNFANTITSVSEFHLFCLAGTGLIGIGGVYLLKKWQSPTFARPLYLIIQLFQLFILASATAVAIVNLSREYYPQPWWLFSAFTCVIAFLFYTASDFIFPFSPFRFLATISLIPVAWLTLKESNPSDTVYAIGWWFWAFILFATGEAASFFKNERISRLSLPFNLAGIPLFFVSALTGIPESIWLGFGLFAASAVVLSLDQIFRMRWWVWTVAVGCWVITWFVFFSLPPIAKLEISSILTISGLVVPLSLVDWLMPGAVNAHRGWRWPVRFFAIPAWFIGVILSLLAKPQDWGVSSLAFGLFTLVGLGYALRFWMPALLPLFTVHLPLSVFFLLQHVRLDWWLPVLTLVSTIYYLFGYGLTIFDRKKHWANAFRWSGLGLGTVLSLLAGTYAGPGDGWYVSILGILFVIETFAYLAWLEVGVHAIYALALSLLLNDNGVTSIHPYLLGVSGISLLLDMFFERTLPRRTPFKIAPRAIAAIIALVGNTALFTSDTPVSVLNIAIGLTYSALFLTYALFYRAPVLLFAFTAQLPFLVVYILNGWQLDWWLPALTLLAIIYYGIGIALNQNPKTWEWSENMRWSGLAVGGFLAATCWTYNGSGDGWYAAVLGLLFIAETFKRLPWLELTVYAIYTLAFIFILQENDVTRLSIYLAGSTIILLGFDMLFERFLANRSAGKILPRVGGMLVALAGNAFLLSGWKNALPADGIAAILYTLLLLGYALFYRKPDLSFPFYFSLTVTVLTLSGLAGLTQAAGVLAMLATTLYFLGFVDKPLGWGQNRRLSGLILATINAFVAIFEGISAWSSLYAALSATVWAVEAFYRRNVWLGFPANGFYLLAYYIILFEINITEPQFFSVGAALLGLLMHYFLTRSSAKTAAFLTGMISQLILLGTSYVQMVANNSLAYFAALFFQSIAVMVYGLVIRSRSLVFTPIFLVVLGVITVLFSVLRGLATVLLIGCTGILFIVLGILAVWQRERIADWRERMSSWNA